MMIRLRQFIALAILLLISNACDFNSHVVPDDLNEERISETTDASTLNSRMLIVNEKLWLDGSSDGTIINSSSNEVDCNSGCDEFIDGSGTVTLNNGNMYCIKSGKTFSGQVNFNGGSLKVCGTYNASSGVAIRGDVENGGTITANADFNVNRNGSLENYGEIKSSQSFNANGMVHNYGTIKTDRDFKINGNSDVINYCSIIAEKQFHVNDDFEQNGYVSVGTITHVNGGGKVISGVGSYFVTDGIHFNGDFLGGNSDYSRLDINNQIVTHNSGILKRRLDVNYTGSIDSGKMESQVTQNADVYIPETSCNPGSGSDDPGDGDSEYPSCVQGTEFTLIGNADSPKVNNVTLSASDVKVRNNYAFVTFHTNVEDIFSGAIDIMDLSNPQKPSIDKSIKFSDTEFNHITFNNDYAFLSGQRHLDDSNYTANNTKGGIIGRFDFLGTTLGSKSDYEEAPIPGYSGNSSHFTDNKLIVVSGGSSGAISTLSENLNLQNTETINYGKFINAGDGKVAILIAGQNGTELRIADSNGNVTDTYNLNLSISPLNGKNVVVLNNEEAYMTLSSGGLAVVNTTNGNIRGTYNHGTPNLANSVDVDDCFVYLANGSDGLVILTKEDLKLFGTIQLAASSNFVNIEEDLIFVANGRGGLSIIEKD